MNLRPDRVRIHAASLSASLLCCFGLLGSLAAQAGSLDGPPGPPAETRYFEDQVGVRLTPAATAQLRGSAQRRPAHTIDGSVLPHIAAAGIAQLEPEFPARSTSGARSAAPASDLSAFHIAKLAPGVTRVHALAALRQAPEVAEAWPIAILPVTSAPNDSLWSRSYHLYQDSRRDLHALEAWDVYRGDSSVVVAILDTGVLPDHPDLGGLSGPTHLWINPRERDGIAGVDDDHNGFIDDFWGWDFVETAPSALVYAGEDWRDADNDPSDFAGHGTAVAGLIGAMVNNQIGVTGLVPDVRLMVLKVGWASVDDPTGVVAMSYAAQAVDYATHMGADVINCSFATNQSPDLEAAVDEAERAGVVVVTAAGNNLTPHELANRPDVISATATDALDKVQGFANRGTYVDLAAPGYALPTTVVHHVGTDSAGVRQPSYSTGATGTSFSSALVSGAVALLQGDRRRRGQPRYTPAEMLLRLVETTVDIRSDNIGISGFGSGRLDVSRALSDPPGSRVIASSDSIVGPMAPFSLRGVQPKLAYVTSDGALVIREGFDGSVLTRASLPAPPASGVAAGWLGGTQGYGFFAVTQDGRLTGIDQQGVEIPGWPVDVGTRGGDVQPALGDVDADGHLDVVLGGRGGVVRAWNRFAEPLPGFPRIVGSDASDVRIALSNLDDSLGVEIVAAASSGSLDVVRIGGGSLRGWPQTIPYSPGAPIVIARDTTRAPEIVVTAFDRVYAYDAGGRRLWMQYAHSFAGHDIAAADLDGDGADEILVPILTFPRVDVIDAAGNILTPLEWTAVSKTPAEGEPITGPLRSRDSTDVAVFVPDLGLIALQPGGGPLLGYPKPGVAGRTAAFGDFNRDDRMDLCAGSSWNGDLYFYQGAVGAATPSTSSWSAARANAARTRSLLYDPSLTESGPDTTRQLLLSRSTIDFGDVWLGTSSQTVLHIINTSADAETVDVSPPEPPFSASLPVLTLAPGATRSLAVQFTPSGRQSWSTILHIHARSGRYDFAVPLSGAGINAPELLVTTDTLRTTLALGSSSILPLQLENRGDAPLAIRPTLELPDRTAPAPVGAASTPAPLKALIVSTTPVTWLEGLMHELGFQTARAPVDTLTPDTLAHADIVLVALDGGWVGSGAVDLLANAARAGAQILMFGGTQYPAFANAVDTRLVANRKVAGWGVSPDPGFVLQSLTGVLSDSLPRRYSWHSREASYYLLRVTDPEAHVIAVNGAGDPILIRKSIGLGSVLLWAGTPNDAAWRDDADRAVIRQVVANAVRAASEWVSIGAGPITIPPRTIGHLDVAFTSVGQDAGMFTGNIRLDSNDPLHSRVRVAIRLDVTESAAPASVPGRAPPSVQRGGR